MDVDVCVWQGGRNFGMLAGSKASCCPGVHRKVSLREEESKKAATFEFDGGVLSQLPATILLDPRIQL